MRPEYDKAPCQDSTGEGCAEEETRHVHCWKLNKHNFCPSAPLHMRSSADKEDVDNHVMQRNDQAEARSADDLEIPNKQAFCTLRHGTCMADKHDGDKHVLRSNDQAEIVSR